MLTDRTSHSLSLTKEYEGASMGFCEGHRVALWLDRLAGSVLMNIELGVYRADLPDQQDRNAQTAPDHLLAEA